MPLGHICKSSRPAVLATDEYRRAGEATGCIAAVSIFGLVGTQASPRAGDGGCRPGRLGHVPDHEPKLHRHHAVALADSDFAQGGLRLASYARPAKLFTANFSLVRSVAGQLNRAAHERVCEALIALIRPGDAAAL